MIAISSTQTSQMIMYSCEQESFQIKSNASLLSDMGQETSENIMHSILNHQKQINIRNDKHAKSSNLKITLPYRGVNEPSLSEPNRCSCSACLKI